MSTLSKIPDQVKPRHLSIAERAANTVTNTVGKRLKAVETMYRARRAKGAE